MPYNFSGPRGVVRYEVAARFGHLPTSSNKTILERLSKYRRPEDGFDPSMIEERVVSAETLKRYGGPEVRYVVCVDGSGYETQEAFNRFPSTRALYMQVAGVFIDLHKMLDQNDEWVDPARIADATQASVVSGFLPSSFLEHEFYDDPVEAFRAELFYLFASTKVQKRSLLDVLLEAAKYIRLEGASAAASRGQLLLTKCPNAECKLSNASGKRNAFPISFDQPANCPSCGCTVWSTDALRIWEAFKPDASNGEVLGRTHQVIEHLVLLGVALGLEDASPRVLQRTAFICDGDLAIFGQAARYHAGLLGAWQALWTRAASRGHEPPVVVGVAKSGYPVEHLRGIHRFIPRRSLMRLDDKYMTTRLRIVSLTETYFGRKLFYHASDDQLLVITVPPNTGAAYGAPGADEDLSAVGRFSTLARALDLLDELGSRLYDDALIPVSLAHHWAAYPLVNTEHVLRLLTDQVLRRKE
ncbi:hypothetical protein ACLQ28_25675 [Micromonospora sp. DT201]|uniref:hypothetical protein n=1 Tax=Micromonospora sp. DT201 TaxID=3393442 RepID=UPI003CEB8750